MICCFLFLAILLGHLRMSIDQMKQALYLMDEEILTPDLLKQLLAFTPNKQEVRILYINCLGTIQHYTDPSIGH